jgi:hypothetical protein
LENSNLNCESSAIMYFPATGKVELKIRNKFEENKSPILKTKIVRNRVGVLFGNIRESLKSRKLVDHLTDSISVFNGQISFFIYVSIQKNKNSILQDLRNNVMPIKSLPYSSSFVYQINFQAEESIKDRCEFICISFKLNNMNTEWKQKLREEEGFGVYVSEEFICVSDTHFEIFQKIFPNSFKFFYFDSLKFWIYSIYKPFGAVYGDAIVKRRQSSIENVLMEKEIENGIKTINNYKRNHFI